MRISGSNRTLCTFTFLNFFVHSGIYQYVPGLFEYILLYTSIYQYLYMYILVYTGMYVVCLGLNCYIQYVPGLS